MLLRALALALLPGAQAGRLTVGSVGSLFSEGILTWDDVLGLDSSATLHVSGKLGTSCGDDVRSQALCALQSVESTFSLGFGIPVEEHPMQVRGLPPSPPPIPCPSPQLPAAHERGARAVGDGVPGVPDRHGRLWCSE